MSDTDHQLSKQSHLPSRQSDRTVTLSESELAYSLGCLI